MGRIAGAPGAKLALRVRWIESLDGLEGGLRRPLVWRATMADAERLAGGVRPDASDLADAALAKRDGGGPRLLKRRLLKALAAGALGVHPDRIAIQREPGGSVRVVSPRPAFASSAARGEWAVVALGSDPIGVDVEVLDPAAPLPLDMLSAEDRRWIEARPTNHRSCAFLTLWTLKEAYLKACGTGLAVAPDRIAAFCTFGAWTIGTDHGPGGRGEVQIGSDTVVAAVVLDPA